MKSIISKALIWAIPALCMTVVLNCTSAPEPVPVSVPEEPKEDVWSLLGRGDERARNYFMSEVDVHETDSRGRTPLHYAAELKDPNLALFFITMGAKIDAVDNEGQTPLGISAALGDPKVAGTLVQAGADIHKPAKGGSSPAITAIRLGGNFLQSILTPSSIESADSKENTILHLASEAGRLSIVTDILAVIGGGSAWTSAIAVPGGTRSFPLDKKNAAGKNPLDLAFAHTDSPEHMAIAEQLILAGSFSGNPIYYYFAPAVRNANYNMRRTGGITTLHYAAGRGYEGLISFLIERNASVNIKDTSGSTPLHEAVRSGRLKIIEMILEEGAEVNAQDAQGNTALHIGVPPEEHEAVISLLLSYDADPNLRDKHGESPLHILAILNRRPEVVQTLLNGGADVSLRNVDGKTPLYLAIQENRISLIPLLLSYGSDIFAADNSGVTPVDRAIINRGPILDIIISPDTVHQNDNAGNTILHAAIKNQADPGIINMILNHKASVNARNKEGDTALHLAVKMNQRENGEYLLLRDADIFSANAADESPLHLALTHSGGVLQWMINDQTITARDGYGNSILHYAAQLKVVSHIPFIVHQGISTEVTNATGETPLFMAVKYDSPSTVRTLLSLYADLNARDSLGNSALHTAVQWNAQQAAGALIDAGIDIDGHALNGMTPLHEAVQRGKSDFVIFLISRGADLEVRDTEGNTPLMEAVKAGYAGPMELLADRGADPMTRNTRGDTPLHIAVLMERKDISGSLLRRGASIHARNIQGRTPFQIALKESPGMITTLLTRDRINSPDDFGNSALHIALQERVPATTIRLIIEQGTRQNPVDSNGRTPLRLAADMGAWESAKILADAGSDPFSAAVDGKTPADVALSGNNEGLRAIFSGKAINARDDSGNTILHYAARQGKPTAIALLLELGANKSLKNISSESPADVAMRWNQRDSAALLN